MKKVVLIVMDGVGVNPSDYGNAVSAARTPTLDMLKKEFSNTQIKAHGTAVGLPSDDDMGNSEVGHNALGCGQIYSQGAKLVNESIETGAMFKSQTWAELTENCIINNSTLHFLGLLSDGNVHSNIKHLFAMMTAAKASGVKKCRIHALLDGRDVPATSAMQYIDALEAKIAELASADFDIKVASGGGRMQITMDRYEANWPMVELGWKTHILGEGRLFASAKEAVETLRAETGAIDQDLPPFVIGDKEPCGTVEDGDSFVLFNFRGDRALEISRAFDDEEFTAFDRKRHPKVVFAGMLQYDGDLKIPRKYLVSPPHIENTLSEALVNAGIKQYAVSETQKFGHVTYFWNGNRSEKFSDNLEVFEEVASDVVPFEQRPWMKAAEVTDKIIEAINSDEYSFIRANYPNGDMVGHTGNLDAAVIAVEAVDLCLARLLKALEGKDDYVLLVTADHGNADEMYEKFKEGKPAKPKTAHTLNPVPFIVVDKTEKREIKAGTFGLANVAATVTKIMDIKTPDMWEESIIK